MSRLSPKTLQGVLFVTIVGLMAHALYSHLGFNPTDEGYMLSGSRRLLDGQVPHRDFLSLRPVGTQLLHSHLILWAGDRILWWSRLIAWVQLATIAWLWVAIVEKAFDTFASAGIRAAVGLAGFAASAHDFPLMPWNTIDGVLFLTGGIAVLQLAEARGRWIGFILIGCAPLFRQSFLFCIPPLLIVSGEGLRVRTWLAVAAPSALYALVLGTFGALVEAIAQTGSHHHSLPGALFAFHAFPKQIGVGLLGGSISVSLLMNRRQELRAVGALAYVVLLVLAAALIGTNRHSWILFFAALVLVPLLAAVDRSDATDARWNGRRTTAALLALVVAWGSSISEGWPMPAIGSASLVAVALAAVMMNQLSPIVTGRNAATLVACTIAAASVTSLHIGRTMHIFCELPAAELKYPLDDRFRGGQGIFTNKNTHDFLKELTESTDWIRSRGRRYAVLPDCAEFWATSAQPNPLFSDWPIDEEIQFVRPRFLHELVGLQDTSFVVQKYRASTLARQPVAIEPKTCMACEAVRSHFRLVRETKYFEIYE